LTVSTTTNRIAYTGNGVTVAFAFPNLFFANTDLKVYVDDVLKTLTTHYAVTGAGAAGGGNVTFGAAPANLSSVVIFCEPDSLQSTKLPSNGPFPSAAVETMSDKLTVLLQRVLDRVSRTLRLSDGDSGTGGSLTLPLAAARANKYPVFDASGNLSVSAGTGTDTGLRTDLAATTTGLGGELVGFKQTAAGALARTVVARMRDTVHLSDYDSLAHAIASITPGAAPGYGGGTIIVPPGDYDVSTSSSSPTVVSKHQLNIRGASRLGSKFLGALDIRDAARGSMSDIWLCGKGTQSFVLGLCAAGGAGAGGWEFERLVITGGLDYGIFVGNGGSNPDVAANTFRQCNLQCGAFGDAASPIQAQIAVAGSNTEPINWIGGVIGGGQMPTNIKLDGGSLALYGVQQINSTLWNSIVNGGQFSDQGKSHIEGTGGYLKMASTDPQPLASAVSILDGINPVTTGANTSGVAVLLESGRQLNISNCFFNEDVTVNNANARLVVDTVRFGLNNAATRNGRFNRPAGHIVGYRPEGVALAYGEAIRLETSDSATYGDTRKGLWRYEGVVLSASDVAGPVGTSMEFRIGEESTANEARVNYRAGSTPLITNIFGAIFVTGAPGAGEIQVKNNGTNDGVSLRAGATYNNVKVSAWIGGK
jgi:hypothetical protein